MSNNAIIDDSSDEDDEPNLAPAVTKKSNFIDDEAEDSNDSDAADRDSDDDENEGSEDENEYQKDGFVVGEEEFEEEELQRKRQRAKRRRAGELIDSDDDDDEEESDDDGDDLQKYKNRKKKKKKKSKKHRRLRKKGALDELDDDDLALIREQQSAYNQNIVASDAQELEKGLFDEDDEDNLDQGYDDTITAASSSRSKSGKNNSKKSSTSNRLAVDRYDEDGLDDFIEDDLDDDDRGGGGIGKSGSGSSSRLVSEMQLNEASEIFGEDYLDFTADDHDLEDDTASDDDDDASSVDSDLSDGDEEERAAARLAKKKKKKLHTLAALKAKFEPAQLMEHFLSERDEFLRKTDAPERYLVHYRDKNIRVSLSSSLEKKKEEEEEDTSDVDGLRPCAEYICRQLFESNMSASNSTSYINLSQEDRNKQLYTTERISSITYAVQHLHNCEPGFLANYRKDYFTSEDVRLRLWDVLDALVGYNEYMLLREKLVVKLRALAHLSKQAAAAAKENEDAMIVDSSSVPAAKVDSIRKELEECEAKLRDVDVEQDLFGDPDEEVVHLKKRVEELHIALSSALDTNGAHSESREDGNDANSNVNTGSRSDEDWMRTRGLLHSYYIELYDTSHFQPEDFHVLYEYIRLLNEGNQAIANPHDSLNKKTTAKKIKWDYYRTCCARNCRALAYQYLLNPYNVGQLLKFHATKTSGSQKFDYQTPLRGVSDPNQWTCPNMDSVSLEEWTDQKIHSGELLSSTNNTATHDQHGGEGGDGLTDLLQPLRYLAAMELGHEPHVRIELYKLYKRHVVLSTRPTLGKGTRELDAFHVLFEASHLKRMPVYLVLQQEEYQMLYLKIVRGVRLGLLELVFHFSEEGEEDIFESLAAAGNSGMLHKKKKNLQQRKEHRWNNNPLFIALNSVYHSLSSSSNNSNANSDGWKEERTKVLKYTLTTYIFPNFESRIRRTLQQLSQVAGIRACRTALYNKVNIGPYRPPSVSKYSRFVDRSLQLDQEQRDYYNNSSNSSSSYRSSSDSSNPIPPTYIGTCIEPGIGLHLAHVSHTGLLLHRTSLPNGLTEDARHDQIEHFLLLTKPDAILIGAGNPHARNEARRLTDALTSAALMYESRNRKLEHEDEEDFEARREKYLLFYKRDEDDDNDEDDTSSKNKKWECSVELLDDSTAQLYARGVRWKKEYPELDRELGIRAALALARYAQNPLAEYCFAFSTCSAGASSSSSVFGGELLYLNIHECQTSISSKMKLLQAYERALVDATCVSGFDIKLASQFKHLTPQLSFVPGLGFRKAQHLSTQLEQYQCNSRRALLLNKMLGPCVYHNAAAFLRFTSSSSSADRDVNDDIRDGYHPLDNTRLHPDVYIRNLWAIKIASDSLEREEKTGDDIRDLLLVLKYSQAEVMRLLVAYKKEWMLKHSQHHHHSSSSALDMDVGDAVFQIDKWNPRRDVSAAHWQDDVEQLDLDTFSDMLEAGKMGKWATHFDMIKWEFRMPYCDYRVPLQGFSIHSNSDSSNGNAWNSNSNNNVDTMDPHQRQQQTLFELISRENDYTLRPGREVTGTIGKELDAGYRLRLGDVDGVQAFIPRRFCPAGNPTDLDVPPSYQEGDVITGIIVEVKKQHWSVDVSLLEADAMRPLLDWPRPPSLRPLVQYFDRHAARMFESEKQNRRKKHLMQVLGNVNAAHARGVGGLSADDLRARQKQHVMSSSGATTAEQEKRNRNISKRILQTRACAHPQFRNCSHDELKREIDSMGESAVGEAYVRASSQKADCLALYWVVDLQLVRMVEVMEEDKPTEASIGNRLLIKDEVYESIDELIGRYVAPMNDRVDEVIRHRKFKRFNGAGLINSSRNGEDMVDEELRELKKRNSSGIFYFLCWMSSSPGYVSLRFIIKSNQVKNHFIAITPEGFVWSVDMMMEKKNRLASSNGNNNKENNRNSNKPLKVYTSIDRLLNAFKKNPYGSMKPSSSGSGSSKNKSQANPSSSAKKSSRWGGKVNRNVAPISRPPPPQQQHGYHHPPYSQQQPPPPPVGVGGSGYAPGYHMQQQQQQHFPPMPPPPPGQQFPPVAGAGFPPPPPPPATQNNSRVPPPPPPPPHRQAY